MDLATLRTAKQAMGEGLITQEDFDQIKVAFLKAQQIKAGMDAGFLREEDYMQARDAFLHSLDFRVSHPMVSAQAAPVSHPVSMQPPGYANGPTLASQSLQKQPSRTSTPPRGPVIAPAQPAGPSGNVLPSSRPGSSGGAASAPAPLNAGAVPIPMDLPRIGRPGASAGKKSMSGISLSDHCLNIFNYIKTKSSYKWAIFKIDDAGNEVVTDQLGASDSSYQNFVSAMPEQLCRYAVFDYAYTNNDTQQTINKLVFVNWAPEGASIKSKMMYASTKDFFKGFLEGVGAELQATDLSELSEAEMRDRVHQALTRK